MIRGKFDFMLRSLETCIKYLLTTELSISYASSVSQLLNCGFSPGRQIKNEEAGTKSVLNVKLEKESDYYRHGKDAYIYL
jgi:hypothetical protein